MYLLKRKKFSEIFVKDICTVACLHRSSFYEHYRDINDLMIQTESELGKKIDEIFKGARPLERNRFVRFFELIKEYGDFYNAYLNCGDEQNMGRADFSRQLKLARSLGYAKDMEFHMAFFAGGLQALCNAWILTGMQKTPDQMADVIIEEYREKAQYLTE